MNQKPDETPSYQVLLVEDNDDDVQLAMESFRLSPWKVNVHQVPDGERCMKFLRKTGPYGGARSPDLVLLDLNMPVMDGREVLAEIEKDQVLSALPTVVLTTSTSQVDLNVAYELHCNSYIIKPIDFDDFFKVIDELCRYWFETVKLPRLG